MDKLKRNREIAEINNTEGRARKKSAKFREIEEENDAVEQPPRKILKTRKVLGAIDQNFSRKPDEMRKGKKLDDVWDSEPGSELESADEEELLQ